MSVVQDETSLRAYTYLVSIDRTTVVDESTRAFSKSSNSVVLAYFYQSSDRSARSCFRSLVKQLLAAMVNSSKPCPKEIREQIEDEFGAPNRHPGTHQVVEDIFIPLLATFSNAIIIVDGIDACDVREQTKLWKYFRRLTSSNNLQITISSQDDTNVVGHLPGFVRVAIDDKLNEKDIDTYIESQLALRASPGQILSDPELRANVKETLQKKAQGMYVTMRLPLFRCSSPRADC